eukprot:scaffold118520_cov60-Phaeocystis_antarctica.AAC.1
MSRAAALLLAVCLSTKLSVCLSVGHLFPTGKPPPSERVAAARGARGAELRIDRPPLPLSLSPTLEAALSRGAVLPH